MMRNIILTTVLCLLAIVAVKADEPTVNAGNLALVVSQIELRPHRDAVIITDRIMQALATRPESYREVLAWADSHLADPTDSLYSDELYLTILERALRDSVLTPAEKLRPRLMAEALAKNRVGSRAATIDYVLPDGSQHTTAELAGRHVLLLFNDPDCDACARVKQRIADNDTIKALVGGGRLAVLAIYSGDNERVWRMTHYPEPIINGWNKSMTVINDDLYYLPSQPLMYLIAPDGTVLIKNEPSLRRLMRVMLSDARP